MVKITIRNIRRNDIPVGQLGILFRHGCLWNDMAAFLPRKPYSYLSRRTVLSELDDEIVASASSLIISLKPVYKNHRWYEITGYGMFTNHNPKGDSLYGADISTHSKVRR